MPDFLEDFAVSVNSKKDVMRGKILTGTPSPLENSFREYFDKNWISLKQTEELTCKPSDVKVLAVDSSVYTNLLSTGGVFYIVRSMGIFSLINKYSVIINTIETIHIPIVTNLF